jgi:hypothetical protein
MVLVDDPQPTGGARVRRWWWWGAVAAVVGCGSPPYELPPDLDLADLPASAYLRVHGASGNGDYGLPVAGGRDIDGDGWGDVVHASMLARDGAGVVSVVLGDGVLAGTRDLGAGGDDVISLLGAQVGETAGSEVWLEDVTGDGLADVLIGRQGYSPSDARLGAGALTIVPGDGAWRGRTSSTLGDEQRHVTLLGGQTGGRLGIWMRAGDVDGDGVADLVLGADGESHDGGGSTHRGAVYVVAGGPHLAVPGTYELCETAAWAGACVRIDPPADEEEGHFGATVQVADLDGNGRAEVLVASALHRAGAGLVPPGLDAMQVHGDGGVGSGRVHVVWDAVFAVRPWPNAFDVTTANAAVLRGEVGSRRFGEELLGGADFDGDGALDLFVGDIIGDATGGRPQAGTGHVLYSVAGIVGLDVGLADLPASVRHTRILGAQTGALSSDTAMVADFDGDGRSDLVLGSPHATPGGRSHAGQLHVLYGRAGGWPPQIDLFDPPPQVRVLNVWGARGRVGGDEGDTLGYSGAAGDVDGDGVVDLIVNEMLGNGVGADAVDVGNLLVIPGTALVAPP